MRATLACAVFVLILIPSCGPLSLYYKPGIAVSRIENDLTDCRVAALRKVPVQNEIDVNPDVFIPPYQSCDGAGNCTTVPGRVIPGRITIFDANEGLRADVTRQCMANNGYERKTVPACPTSIAQAVIPAQTSIMPRLTKRSCAIKYREGRWQIVEQG